MKPKGWGKMIINKLNDIINNSQTSDPRYMISSFIKQNILILNTLTIKEVADGSHVSKAMISKFVKELGYDSFIDLKENCQMYVMSIGLKDHYFQLEQDYQTNSLDLVRRMNDLLLNTVKQIDYQVLEQLVNEIKNCSCLYLLGHGEAKGLCSMIQIELDALQIPIVVVDVDFRKEYQIDGKSMFLIISVNGNTLMYNHRTISKILKLKQRAWLITCNHDIPFEGMRLDVPSTDVTLNKINIRFVTDLIIARLQQL